VLLAQRMQRMKERLRVRPSRARDQHALGAREQAAKLERASDALEEIDLRSRRRRVAQKRPETSVSRVEIFCGKP
jgi:hypothetical protein